MVAEKARLVQRFLRSSIVAACLILSLTVHVLADTATPTTPCDPNYMDAIEARAYLEAQREITQNQNLIFKPDSVLQYTCFDNFLNQVGGDTNWRGNSPFSDSETWGPVPNQGPGDLQDNLSDVVESAVSTYLTSNFDNNYLGGRSDDKYTASTYLSGGSYSCSEMKTVWLDAQCMNFMNKDTRDGFYDFPFYSTDANDPRKYPDGTGSCSAPTNFSANITTAFNQKEKSYTLQTENPWPNSGDYYTSDDIVTHFNLIMPQGVQVGANATANPCASPISTGICVVRTSWSTVYGDAVCPNPGCHYKAPGDSASSTPAATGCTGQLQIGTCEVNAGTGGP